APCLRESCSKRTPQSPCCPLFASDSCPRRKKIRCFRTRLFFQERRKTPSIRNPHSKAPRPKQALSTRRRWKKHCRLHLSRRRAKLCFQARRTIKKHTCLCLSDFAAELFPSNGRCGQKHS